MPSSCEPGGLTRLRLGFRNIGDIDNGKMRKTSYTTLLNGQNVYRYSYVVPMQVEANVTVRF